jgi:hypothetical protein
LEKRIGNPVRLLGVVFVLVLAVLLFLLQGFARGPIVTAAVQSALERVNGATVDLAGADLNLKDSRFTIEGLAMADPNDLGRDIFRAVSIEANVNAASLLSKRLHLERVVVSGASSGDERRAPGFRWRPAVPEPEEEKEKVTGVKTLDDYLKDAEVWRERLAQAKQWMEKISGPAEEGGATPSADGGTKEKTETLEERLRRQVEELGYHRVRAEHLIRRTPTLTISELATEGMKLGSMPNETLTVRGLNLSTHPALLGEVPELEVSSSGGTMGFATRLGQFGTSPGTNMLAMHYNGLVTDEVVGQLKIAGEKPLRGGTIDLSAQGSWTTASGVSVNLPLMATLHQVTVAIPGVQPTEVQQLQVPIGVEGPLDRPRIVVDDKGLSKALVDAGVQRAKDELQNRAKDELNKQVGGALGEQLGEQGGKILDGIFGGKKK